MIVQHSLRALAAATAALLLASAPLGAFADEPGPLTPTVDVPAPALPPSTSTAPMLAPSAQIHPGDQLAIGVYGNPALSQNVTVQADGSVQYPLVGRVVVGGKTPTEARNTIASSLGHYLKHPQVTLSIAQSGQMTVLVLGNVKTPGKFSVQSGARLSDALAAAGGVATMNGEYPPARVTEADGSMANADLQKLIAKGDATQNVPLDNNAIVYVTGGETIRVQVLGAVTRPGNVEVHEGDRLSMALARAGAEAQAKPDLNHVYVTRKDVTSGKTVSYQVDMFQALERGDQRFDPILQKNDTVYVPEARSVSAASIGLLGILGHFLRL